MAETLTSLFGVDIQKPPAQLRNTRCCRPGCSLNLARELTRRSRIRLEFVAHAPFIVPCGVHGRGHGRGGDEHHPDVDRSRWLNRPAPLGRAYGAERHPARLRPALAPISWAHARRTFPGFYGRPWRHRSVA